MTEIYYLCRRNLENVLYIETAWSKIQTLVGRVLIRSSFLILTPV